MYVIAICGAYGSPIRTFAEDLYEFVNGKESSLSIILIDENEFLHDVTKGRDLHLMSELPESSAEYENSYIFIKKGKTQTLYYMKPGGVCETVGINDFNLFEKQIGNIEHTDKTKWHLSEEQIKKIITENGGHTLTKRFLVDFRGLAAHISKQDKKSIVLVVGNCLFLNKDLQKTFNIRLFIDTANDICLSNHIKSQSEKRELDLVIDEYMKLLKPENDDHVNPSGKRADVIVPADKDFTIIFNLLFSSIQASLQPKESRVYDERDEEKSGYSFFG
ncbi:hypothetical protein [Legionella spiritensis]|uniref:hypothetical protein n=1 Tax=Legionella spiritensis TaxID=452 RepID=UPI000F71498A|nr:hypothetical protein [Legionella spiritensis]VEG89730.1 uridine kinase [Legionella spiritensis]